MFQLVQRNDEAADIEQFRTLHRRLFRIQHELLKTEALDEDDGRKRKISANWHQKQQQARTNKLQNDGQWLPAAGTNTMVHSNAFNNATLSDTFDREPCDAVSSATQHMADVASQVASMGFQYTSTWLPTDGPIPHYMAW
ncbi:hypothetical protein KXD40_008468 [Peronospora effusa]|uniref:Uncharacterized protein n=1 Tax=Peronospora effusa TaxID=542832 RepID=A0A3M6V8P5_9STRA|nr:hypothetical protein DD238_007604 [Peronospora effusa]RQM13079.1 hypothetical protein DD237_002931 [Peronospora effusa]UIZ24517.1 hypothetical protein KXD40_008468 [Peronospora effusa]CAI5700974.1 unnamed protein product [Peronospora effusa]